MKPSTLSPEEIERKALSEFSGLHLKLYNAGIRVVLHCAERFHDTPDAVFPNNWLSTHPASEVGVPTVIFYPMKWLSRRAERRQNIISELQAVYDRELSFTQWEFSDFPHFLEGSGVLIMDRLNKIAYACLSDRCNKRIGTMWANKLGYSLVLFHAVDIKGRPVFHTNMVMSVGTSIAFVCLEAVEDQQEREILEKSLSKSHTILALTREQMRHYCSNVLELNNGKGKKILCMSSRVFYQLTDKQKALVLQHVDEILHSDISTIETVGGAGVHSVVAELF